MPEVLLRGDPVGSLQEYRATGGGHAFAAATQVDPATLVDLITASGLRGRGGGGFPTGRKWAGIRAAGPGRRFAVCNAAEGEPGTFKDRALIRHDPYRVLEGLAIAGWAIGAEAAYIATKRTYAIEAERLARAIEEIEAEGFFADLPITLVLGPDEYLFGEEKALLGQAVDAPTGLGQGSGRGQPNPTLVNNVETLAHVPGIVIEGAEWFRAMGTPESPGTTVATVVGDVQAPLVTEVELGTPLSALIARAGGARPGRTLQAAFSGVANAVITPEHFDAPVSYEGLAAAGSGMGSAGFVLYDDTACMVDVARTLSRFLYVESCGQCRACKFGTGEITRNLDLIAAGEGRDQHVEIIGARLRSVTDQTRCFLAAEEQILVSSLLRAFPEEFALHLEGRCSHEPRPIVVPKLVEVADGVATYDPNQARKQPDWTYAEP